MGMMLGRRLRGNSTPISSNRVESHSAVSVVFSQSKRSK
jgi:hypothetical protein